MPRNIDPGTLKVGSGLASKESVEAQVVGPASTAGLDAHTSDPVGAHPASAISLADDAGAYDGDNVQDGFDELAALVPPRPPGAGKEVSYLSVSGIPDWGFLKLRDGGLIANGVVTPPDPSNPNTDADLYPYFHVVPSYANGFTVGGNDPATDPVFNVDDPSYTGGGLGGAFQGGFTRGSAVVETARILPKPGTGNNFAVVSGVLSPADRGVLALIYIPPGGTLADFTTQPQSARCIAALLCGLGIESGCDGDPGGIFTLGADTGDGFDPYSFPGRATGQFDLEELHTGVSSTGGANPPAADPNAGRVRIGFDILGATTSADPPPLAGAADNRNDNNFFRYRLPYLSDYSTLNFVPEVERPRYFTKPAVAADPGTDLTTAGNYDGFGKDYWAFQVARFRHRFEFPAVSGSGARDIGSFVLLHFRTEKAFEALVVDGVVPTSADLYSANAVSWSNVEDPSNLSDGAGPAASYHILRAALVEDPNGAAAPTATTAVATFQPGSPVNVQAISGVRYFVPRAQANPWKFTTVSFAANGVWDATYRVASTSPATPGLEGPDTGFLWVGAFSRDTNFVVSSGAGIAKAGRIEMNMTHLGLTDGPFSLSNPPSPTDTCDFSISSLQPTGDSQEPSFSRDAKLRMFIRRPLGSTSASTAVFGFDLNTVDKILFHSTDESVFANPSSASLADSATFTAQKDVEERFLDEVYRYDADFPSVPSSDQALLVGPGLAEVKTLHVPVRAGLTTDVKYSGSSWVQAGNHLAALPSNEAQVAGLPDRNPPLSDGVAEAAPSSGMLVYPQIDFSTGYRPSGPSGAGDISVDQPDYSGETGDRLYVRAFDVGFKNSSDPVAAEGTAFAVIKVRGLQLADFAYDPPGPGSSAVAIMVKVPGHTTWMDIGRVDGDGPSKQDPFDDGAGCQVVGSETFDSVDPRTGIVECQVKINVGPTATFFLSSEGTVPLLVKVILKDTPEGRALNLEQGGPSGSVASLRGLIGLEILRPS